MEDWLKCQISSKPKFTVKTEGCHSKIYTEQLYTKVVNAQIAQGKANTIPFHQT
mgnify:CR=1 FL=1